MQIIHACSFSPEEYASSELHRQVRAPQCCPWCGKAGVLEALGYYRRYVSASAGKVLQIGVRRFLCRWCRITVSLLPGFAHPYRLVQSKGIEQFFNGEREGPLVAAWRDLLLTYWKCFCGFCEQLPGGLRATLGAVLARGPPGPEPEKLWRRLLLYHQSAAATIHWLVDLFGITLLGRYHCHRKSNQASTAEQV